MALVVTPFVAVQAAHEAGSAPPTKPARALTGLPALPLAFEPNRGQFADDVRFVARGAGAALALTDRELRFALPAAGGRKEEIALRFTSGAGSSLEGAALLPGRVNYLLGDDPAKWQRNVPTYRQVRVANIAAGADLVVYGLQRRLEYDLVLAPRADPGKLSLSFAGVERLRVAANGDLLIDTPSRTIRQLRPVTYQHIDGARRPVASEYVLRGSSAFGFRVGSYDRSKPLVIDPVLPFYSTYVGGAGSDAATSVAVDGSGNAYVAGWTASVDFPLRGAVDASPASDPSFCSSNPCAEAFVTKLNPTGSAVVYSTYLGGTWSERATAIDVDAAGHAYVTGVTTSTDFPTANAYDATRANGAIGDVFVSKLSPDGSSFLYSTYLGGFGTEDSVGIDVAVDGSATVAGNTRATDFPVTPGAYRSACERDAASGDCYPSFFVTKLAPSGTSLAYSTYVPAGTGLSFATDMAVGGAGTVYLTGSSAEEDFPVTPGAFQTTRTSLSGYEAFAMKIVDGTTLAFSTLLGAEYGRDEGQGIAVDAAGAVYLTGRTDSERFPVTPDAFDATCQTVEANDCGNVYDAFISKLSPDASRLVYSTFFGAGSRDLGREIAVAAGGDVVVTGEASGLGLPTREPYQGQPRNANCAFALSDFCGDVFLARFAPDWTLTYSTYFGAHNLTDSADVVHGLALDDDGSAYIAGATASTFLATPGAVDETCGVSADGNCDNNASDAFVAKFHYVHAAAPCSTTGGVMTVRVPPGGSSTVSRAGDAILVDGASCGATVTTVSSINATGGAGEETFVVDLAGGHLAPGSRREPDGDEEIKLFVDLGSGTDELVVRGTPNGDRILLSRDWAELTPDGDDDLIPIGVERMTVDGGPGSDELSAYGTGIAFRVIGGPGADTLNGSPGDDVIDSRDGEIDTVTCRAGNDTVSADSADSVAADCETVTRDGSAPPPAGPPNDDLASATPTSVSGATLTASSAGASKQAGEPDHAGAPGGASVWYHWTAPADGLLAVTTNGTTWDTLLSAYQGTGFADLVPVAQNDDWVTASQTRTVSTIRFRVTAGAEYLIAVDGKAGAAGTFTLGFMFTRPTQPNDLWLDAQTMPGAAGWLEGNGTASTVEFDEPYHNGHSVWYRWVAPTTGIAAFRTAHAGSGGVAVYTGATFDLLTNAPVADRGYETQLNTTAGATYWVAVTHADPFTLTWRSGPPANDSFAAAEWIGYPQSTLAVANGSATREAGEPVHASATGGASIWFRWTAPSTGRAEFYTWMLDVDTILAVYTGTRLDALTLVGQNDDRTATDRRSTVSFDAVAGRVYRIALDVKNGAWTTFDLNWNVNVSAVTGETLEGAATIAGSSGTVFSGVGTGKQAEEPDHAGNPGGRSSWLRWTAPATGTHTFETAGSGFNTLLAVYRGYVRNDIRTLTLVAANDDVSASDRTSRVTFEAVAGETYHIALDGWSDGLSVATGHPLVLAWRPGAGAPPDVVPPDTTIVSGPSGTVTSLSASFSFSSEPGATFECKLDAGTWSACTSPTAYGSLSGGSHTFEVRALDAAGNVDGSPATRTWTISNDAFAAAVALAGAAGSYSGSTAGATKESGEPRHAGNRGGRSVWFRWTAPAAGTATIDTIGSSFDTLLGVYTGTTVGALTRVASDDDSGGNRTSRVTFTAVAGRTYSIAVDGKNGASGSYALRWSGQVGDTTAPDTTITAGPSGTTSATTASLSFASTETGSTFECRLDGAAWTACVSPRSYSGLAEGSHTFDVRARDAAGNVDATPASRTWTVAAGPDTTAPETTITAGPSGATASSSASFSFAASEAGATFECALDSAAFTACSSPLTVASLADGLHTFRVRARDAAGNIDATPAERSWTVDTTAPDTSITGGPSGTTTTGDASFTFASPEAGATFECRLDAGGWATCTTPRSYSGLGAGSHTFEVRARDAVGNLDATPASRTWTVSAPADTTPPDTAITSGPTGTTTSASATFSFTATEAGATFECRLDGAAFATCASPATYSGLSASSHTFEVRARDAVGNVDATPSTRTWTVAPATSNDMFANAAALSGTGGNATGSTTAATKEAGEPGHGGNAGGKSVWYRWTAPASGTLTVDTVGSSFDTTLGVYAGAAVNALTTLAGDDDSAGNLKSRVNLTVTAGATYSVAVDGYGGASGSVTLNWTLAAASGPANDMFGAARTLTGGSGTVTATTVGATKESGEPSHGGNAGGKSIWFAWTAPKTGTVTVDTIGSPFDTLLAAYSGSVVSGLTQLASNDDASGTQSRISFAAAGGTTYRVAVDGYGGAAGAVTLNWSQP